MIFVKLASVLLGVGLALAQDDTVPQQGPGDRRDDSMTLSSSFDYGSMGSAVTHAPVNLAKCQTLLTCAGETVIRTVHTVTTTIVGVYPTTTITVFPTAAGDDGTTTVTIVPGTHTYHYITSTLTVGGSLSTSVGQGEPGAPGTIIVVAPGPPPSSTTTITTSLHGLRPVTTMTIHGLPPSPSGPCTKLIVPPNSGTSLPTDWTCSCLTEAAATKTVTVTRPASKVSSVTETGADGTPTPKSPSNFPCSDNDDNPCRGAILSAWQPFSVSWTAAYPRPGPPAPFIKKVSFEDDGILTVTDDENKAEHFEVKLDGKVLGETRENGFDRSKHCGKDADGCIQKGWSHGYFSVPKGEHELSIQWTKGDMKGWWYGAGQYRFEKTCTC
ncbi:MAG: hypothetical protein MMC23_006634 [Stictis urceolatum]|nr:hypothetical protein [Stictis urceolata]